MRCEKVLLEYGLHNEYSKPRILAALLLSEGENSWRIWHSNALFSTVIPKDPEYGYRIIPR